MDEERTLIIDMDKRCLECGKRGATASGICLKCFGKAVTTQPMQSARGRDIQAALRAQLRKNMRDLKEETS